VIAATNRNIEEAIEAGAFRSDLMYRLNVIPIQMPPLCERGDDIKLLTQHFVTVFAREFKKPITTIDDTAYSKLFGYSWPGNVRELRNVLERAALLCDDDKISSGDILLGPADATAVTANGAAFILPPNGVDLHDLENGPIRQALARANNNQTQAAKLLHLSRDAFRYRLEKLGLL